MMEPGQESFYSVPHRSHSVAVTAVEGCTVWYFKDGIGDRWWEADMFSAVLQSSFVFLVDPNVKLWNKK